MADTPAPAPNDDLARRDRLSELLTHAMLRGAVRPTLWGFGVALLVPALFWRSADHAALLAWLAARYGVSLLRMLHLATACDARGLRHSPAQVRRVYMLLLVPDALLWGLAGVLFAPVGTLDAMIVTTLMVGIAAVVVMSKGSNAAAGTLFVTGVISPSLLAYAASGEHTLLVVAAGLATYLGMMVMEVRRVEQRRSEQALLRLENERIADERQRALLLAEHSNAAKTRFLAAVSHEMRTPLNGVLGMTELLQRSPLSDEQRARLEVVRRSAQHLQTVIADLLDLSRIEFGKLAIEAQPFELRATVREVTELLRAVALAQGLALSVRFARGAEPRLVGDASRIKQVLHNLIGNAIKFTAAGGIELEAATLRQPDGSVLLRLVVLDTGDGLDAAQAEHLFDAFAQGPASDRRSGTGLGLTISRQLARSMGGDVVYASRSPHGSAFTFTARLVPAPPEPQRPRAANPEPPPLHGRVLVADDNPVNALVASSMLQTFGLAVDVAEDGQQALELMAARRYDAVLMDCHMPRLDGFEATRRWRERERRGEVRHLPIVALTANAIVGDREQCLDAGMDDYLAKPFEMQQLHGVLEHWLSVTR